MPPDRGRASRACTACRKIKTRCYESEISGRPCLRCDRLGQPCSLDARPPGGGGGHVGGESSSSSISDDRLDRLEQTVSALVKRLDEGSVLLRQAAPAPPPMVSSAPLVPPPVNDSASGANSSAPVLLLRDVAYEVGVRQQSAPAARGQNLALDVIDRGLITVEEASVMVGLFQEHYGRWVLFNPAVSPGNLLREVRKSPLLLCAVCLIAVRHREQELAASVAPQLFQEAKARLSSSVLDVPQSPAFFQAALVLSMWSTSIGQTPLSIDSWLVSGFALQHSLASDVFAPVNSYPYSAALRSHELDHWCLWNHICLAHLHYCVGTKRKSILDRQQILKCRKILDSDHATNFEVRMVAEVNLYWIVYENCSKPSVDLQNTHAALHEWREEWKFLFNQPRPQFLQMGFQFAQLLVFDQALKSRSASVRESIVSEMVRLSASIIKLALDTADARTRHLSDHIYHMITFAAVTLCRLLHMYDHQVATMHNVPELDTLVLTLVSWLRSIGLPCHVAHTLGGVVEAFHQKLRPHANPTADEQTQNDLRLYFPDLLGIETFDGGGFDFLPDWEPQIQPAMP